MEELKDPVKLKVFNLCDNTEKILDTIHERVVLEHWIEYQVKEMGAQFHQWEVIKI